MEQCIANKVGQCTSNCSLNSLYYEGPVIRLLERQFDSGVECRGTEICKHIPRYNCQIQGAFLNRMALEPCQIQHGGDQRTEATDVTYEFALQYWLGHVFDLGPQQGQRCSELVGSVAKKSALQLYVCVDLAKGSVESVNQRLQFDRYFIKRNKALRCCRVDRKRKPCDALDAASDEACCQNRANDYRGRKSNRQKRDREEIARNKRHHDLSRADLCLADQHHQRGRGPWDDDEAKSPLLVSRVQNGKPDWSCVW